MRAPCLVCHALVEGSEIREEVWLLEHRPCSACASVLARGGRIIREDEGDVRRVAALQRAGHYVPVHSAEVRRYAEGGTKMSARGSGG